MKNMKEFNPDNMDVTSTHMLEKTITVIDKLPQYTAVSDDQLLEFQEDIPTCMTPKKITVKRYVLKK